MRRRLLLLCSSVCVGVLAGCAGGGGGEVPVPVPIPVLPFTSWSAVTPNTTVQANGISQTGSANYTVAPSGDLTLTHLAPFSAVDTMSSSATFTFGSIRQLTALSIVTPAGTASWNTATAGTTLACTTGFCLAANATGTSAAVAIDPYFLGWNYQTFAFWATGTATTGTLGAISVGARTPATGLPVEALAVYTGMTAGYYSDPNGQFFGAAALFDATADFGNRTIAFSTSGTNLSTVNGTLTPAAGLDLSGTLSYASGTTLFTGPLHTADGRLSGNATGSFYGPGGEELGGLYSLNGPGALEAMIGGFGVRQLPPFTSWSAVHANSPVAPQGISQSALFEYSVSPDVTVTSVGAFTPIEKGIATFSYDNFHNPTAFGIYSPSASASWNTSVGDTIDCIPFVCSASNATGRGDFGNQYGPTQNWNYQTFGAWSYETNGTINPRTGNFGAISVGAMTPAVALSSLPFATATYTGRAAGFYMDSMGTPFSTVATMSATVDFTARTVNLSTIYTSASNLNTSTGSAMPSLDLSGPTLTYTVGGNQFTGVVTTASGSLTGMATGNFYGPAAEEIGGIYTLKGAAQPEAMVGGFGGKR